MSLPFCSIPNSTWNFPPYYQVKFRHQQPHPWAMLNSKSPPTRRSLIHDAITVAPNPPPPSPQKQRTKTNNQSITINGAELVMERELDKESRGRGSTIDRSKEGHTHQQGFPSPTFPKARSPSSGDGGEEDPMKPTQIDLHLNWGRFIDQLWSKVGYWISPPYSVLPQRRIVV